MRPVCYNAIDRYGQWQKWKGVPAINPQFWNLDAEKQNRIIGAAMREFAQKGYKNASTNGIVKNARISKGLLFHYFGSKKELFCFLLDYSRKIFRDEFLSRLNTGRTDLITRLRDVGLLKIELARKYPDLYGFMLGSMTDDSAEIRPEMQKLYSDSFNKEFYKVIANVDTSGIKDGLDKKRVSEVIVWTVQSFAKRELDKLNSHTTGKNEFDLMAVTADFDAYLELLRNAFYK